MDEAGEAPFGPPESWVTDHYDWTAHLTGRGGPPLQKVPSRQDFVYTSSDGGKKEHHRTNKTLNSGGLVLFQPWDVHESVQFIRQPGMGGSQQRYQLNLLGHLPDGSSARVVVNDAPVYFGVWFPEDGDASRWLSTVTGLLQEFQLERHEIGEGYPLRGYRDHPRRFVKLFFPSLKQRRSAIAAVRAHEFETFSDDRSNYFRMLARENFLPLCSWLAVGQYVYARGNEGGRACSCDDCRATAGSTRRDDSTQVSHVLTVPMESLRGLVNPLDPDAATEKLVAKNPLLSRERALVMTFDIETHSPDKGLGTPPTATKPNDVVFMLCASVHWRSDPRPLASVCLTTVKAAPDGRWTTVLCGDPSRPTTDNQASLIMAFAELVRLWQPQVVTGFNDGQYDWPFLVEKADQLGILVPMFERLSVIGRRNLKEEDVLKWNWNTERPIKIDADKRHFVSYLKAPGYVPVDVRVSYMKLYPKAPKSSLKYFLGRVGLGGKADMPYQLMWKYYEAAEALAAGQGGSEQQTAEHMRRVAHYCVIDAVRCQEMLVKRNVIQNNREVGNYSFTCFSDCIYYAGGHKVCNMLFAYAADSGARHGRAIYGSMIADREHIEGKYPGAFVVPPEKGLEEDFPVTGLDFSSLYPSLIRTYNFSLEMYLSSEEEARAYEARGEKIHRVSFPFGGREVKGWFVQHQNSPDKIGLFARALGDLYDKRTGMKLVLKPLEAKIEQFSALINEFRKGAGGVDFRAHLAAALGDLQLKIREREAQIAELRDTQLPAGATDQKKKRKKKLYNHRKKLKKSKSRFVDLSEFLAREHCATASDDALMHELVEHLEELEFELVGVDSKQKAVKVFMNTFYGEAGNKLSPLFYLPLAGGVTSAGQYNLLLIKKFVEWHGFRVKYGDTDSLYLCCPPECYAKAIAEYEQALAALGVVAPPDPAIQEWNQKRQAILAQIAQTTDELNKLVALVAQNVPDVSVTPEFVTSPQFSEAYPQLGQVVATGVKRHHDVVGGLRAEERKLGPCPPPADRYWLQKVFDARPDVEEPVRAAYEKLCVEKVEITMDVMGEARDKVNRHLFEDNGGEILKLAYEEVCFPSDWTGKKKYFAIAHMEQPNFHITKAKDIFVRGIDIVKQGQTRLAVEIGQQCMWEATRLCPPGTRVPLIERVENVLRKNCTDIGGFRANGPGTGTWTLSDFVQSDAWKPDKDNKPVQTFMKRMAVRHKLQLRENASRVAEGLPPNELDYIPPEPGSRFDYLLVDTPREFDLRGYALPSGKKGNLMEYVHIAKKRNSRINVKYYLSNYVVGLCARFINYEERFAHPNLGRPGVPQPDEKLQDEFSQKAAKKHLTKLIDSFSSSGGAGDQKRGRSYKRAFAKASQRAGETLRTQLGDSAKILLGVNNLSGRAATGDAPDRPIDYEFFLPGVLEEEEEAVTALPLAERFRIAAAEQASGLFDELEEENYTGRLIRDAGINSSSDGRRQLYRFLDHWQQPSRRALLRRSNNSYEHPAAAFDRSLATQEHETFLQIEDLEDTVAGVAERLQTTLEELVALEREIENRQNGLADGELSDLSAEVVEAGVEKTAAALTVSAGERRALREMHGCWERLAAVTFQRLVRRRVVDQLHAIRDRAL